MSKAFQTRLKSQEQFFQNRALQNFKIRARRNRLFGLWAAEQLNLELQEKQLYISKLVTNFLAENDDSLLNHIFNDLLKKKKLFSMHQLKKQLDYFYREALKQMENEDT